MLKPGKYLNIRMQSEKKVQGEIY